MIVNSKRDLCCPECGGDSWSMIIKTEWGVHNLSSDDILNCINCNWSGTEKELIFKNDFLRKQKALLRKQKLNKINGE
jgi:hypothetical protein